MHRILLLSLLSTLAVACQEPASTPSTSGATGAESPAPGGGLETEAPREPEDVAAGGCVRAGCAGQLCVPEGEEPMTTCEERPEYACYRAAVCERQPDGSCGFTPSAELERCLANP